MLSDLRVQTESREKKGWGEKDMKVNREGKRRGRDGR